MRRNCSELAVSITSSSAFTAASMVFATITGVGNQTGPDQGTGSAGGKRKCKKKKVYSCATALETMRQRHEAAESHVRRKGSSAREKDPVDDIAQNPRHCRDTGGVSQGQGPDMVRKDDSIDGIGHIQ